MNRVQNVLSNRAALPLGPVWLRYTLRESLATARTPFMDPRPTANRREWQSAAAARAAATAATAVAAASASGRRRRHRLHRRAKREHARPGALLPATPPPPRSAMPMWKISTSSGSSSDERQRATAARSSWRRSCRSRTRPRSTSLGFEPSASRLICSSRSG